MSLDLLAVTGWAVSHGLLTQSCMQDFRQQETDLVATVSYFSADIILETLKTHSAAFNS